MFRFTSNPSRPPKALLIPGFPGETAQTIGKLISQILLPETTEQAVQLQIASLEVILQGCKEEDLMSRTLLDTVLPSGKSLHLGGDTFLNFLYAEATRIFDTSSTAQQKTGATTNRLYQLVKLLMDAVKLNASRKNAIESASAESMRSPLSVYAKMVTTHNFAHMYPLHRVLEMGDIRCTQQLVESLQYILDNELYPVTALQTMLISSYKSTLVTQITTPLALVIQHKNTELLEVFLPFYVKVVGVTPLMATIDEQKINGGLPDSIIKTLEKFCATEAKILPQIPTICRQPQTKILPLHVATIERALSQDRYLEEFNDLLKTLDQYTLANMQDSDGNNLLMVVYLIAGTQIRKQNLEGAIKIAYSERVTRLVNLLLTRSEQLTQLDGTQNKINLFMLTHFQNRGRPFSPMHAAIVTTSPIILNQYMLKLFSYVNTKAYSRENLQLMLTTSAEPMNPFKTALAYASQTANSDVLQIIIHAMGTVLSGPELLRHLTVTKQNLDHLPCDQAQKYALSELLSAEQQIVNALMVSQKQAQASARELELRSRFQASVEQQAFSVPHLPMFYPQNSMHFAAPPVTTQQPPHFVGFHAHPHPQAYSTPLPVGIETQSPMDWVRPVGFLPPNLPRPGHFHTPPHQQTHYAHRQRSSHQPRIRGVAPHPTQAVSILQPAIDIAAPTQTAQSISNEKFPAVVTAPNGAGVSVGTNPHTLLAVPRAGSIPVARPGLTANGQQEGNGLNQEQSKTSLL